MLKRVRFEERSGDIESLSQLVRVNWGSSEQQMMGAALSLGRQRSNVRHTREGDTGGTG